MTAPPAGALEACPFCGERIDVVSNRDWHRLAGEHAEWCPLADYEFATPATNDDLAAAIAAWNRRTPGPALLAALRLREGCAELVARIEREADAHTYFADNSDLRMTAGDHAKRAAQLTTIRDDLARVLEESATGDEAARRTTWQS